MYDAQEVLNNIDDDKWWVLTFCGLAMLMWAWFTGMGTFFYPAAAIWFGDEWRCWQWYALGAISVGGGAVMTYVVHQMRTNGRTFGLVAPDTTSAPAAAPAGV